MKNTEWELLARHPEDFADASILRSKIIEGGRIFWVTCEFYYLSLSVAYPPVVDLF